MRLLASPLVRYLAIGGLSFVVDAGLLLLLAEVMDVPVWLAATVGFWTGVVVNFSLNRVAMGGRRRAGVLRQTLRYGVLLVVNYLGTLALLHLGAQLGIPVVVAKTAAVVLFTALNFVLYRRWVFA